MAGRRKAPPAVSVWLTPNIKDDKTRNPELDVRIKLTDRAKAINVAQDDVK